MTGHRPTHSGQTNALEEIKATVTVLEQATKVTTILSASLATFQIIRQLARSCEDHAPDLFAALLCAAGAATEGCEWIMLSASAPPGSPPAGITVPPGTGTEEIADWLAVLAAALTGRLAAGAAMATAPGDRAAFQNAAAAAQAVHDLLTGPGHDPSPR